MADLTLPPDDADLDARLTSLGALPVADLPTIADLKGRAARERLDTAPVGGPGPDAVELTPSPEPDPPGPRGSRRWWLVAAAVVAVLLVAAAAFGAVRRSQSVASGAGALAGRDFRSIAVTEAGTPKPMPTTGIADLPVRVSLSFDEDGETLSAGAGCNGLRSTYAVDDGRLVLGDDGSSTLMACAPELEALDDWLQRFLSASPTIVLDGDRLTLTGGDTVIELVDDEVLDPDRTLIGPEWQLDSVIEGPVVKGSALGPTTIRPGFRIVEAPGGELTLEGGAGCPGVQAPVTVEGDRLVVGEATPREVFCPAPVPGGTTVDADADAFAGLFGTEWTYTIDANQLTLMAGDHGLVFRTPDPATPVETTPSTTEPATTPGSPPPLTGLDSVEALVGTRWELVAVEDQDGLTMLRLRPGDPPLPYLLFAGDSTAFAQTMVGADRCGGEIRGEFLFTEQQVELHDVSRTDGVCPDADAMRTSAAMGAVMTGTPTFSTTPTNLVFVQGGTKLFFQSGGNLDTTGADLALVGPQWTVMRAGDGRGDVVAAWPDTVVFVEHEPGSAQLDLLGFTGCQQFTASAQIDGDTFTAVDRPATTPDCTPGFEDSLLGSVLEPGAGYAITGSVLKIRAGDRWVELAGSDTATAGGTMVPPAPGS